MQLFFCGEEPMIVRQTRMRLLGIICVLMSSCAPIPPYAVLVPVPKESLFPPSAPLEAYTSNPVSHQSAGLTLQLARTTQQCGVVKQQIAVEMSRRDARVSFRTQAMVVIGSAAALATTIYSGVEDNPRKGILVPLGAVSGSSLLSALPALGKDERVTALRDKLAAIKAQESASITAVNGFEQNLRDVALLEEQQGRLRVGSADWKKLQSQIDDKHIQMLPIESALRVTLAGLANECT